MTIQKIVGFVHRGFFSLYETESDRNDWVDHYRSYFQTCIEKDTKDILNVQDESAFIKFVKVTASLTGQMLNFSTVAEIFGKDIGRYRLGSQYWIPVA